MKAFGLWCIGFCLWVRGCDKFFQNLSFDSGVISGDIKIRFASCVCSPWAKKF